MSEELKILTPIGMLGYGIPEPFFWRGVQAGPDAIVVDAGSTDPGPYQLGLGKMIVTREAYLKDLALLLRACAEHRIPLFISSAGGPGIDEHVDAMLEMIREIASARGWRFKTAAIYSDVDPALVRARLAEGRITPCGPAPGLEPRAIDNARHIVAQMGGEPFMKALREQPDLDIVVAGRSYDPAPAAALCALRGIPPGVYWHMAKIVECGANCAEPKGRVILATIRKDSFDLEPMNPDERCTTTSVAAHTLYEKSRPDLLAGPGGTLDLSGSRYEQLDDRRVRVSGSAFVPAVPYTVKLEGAGVIGYRTIFIGGVRDPILIDQIDDFLERVRARTAATFPDLEAGRARLLFHVYGKNAVMGPAEPLKDARPHEIGVLGEATAATQELADAICSQARITVLHMPYPGQMATAGNFAIPLTPPENPIGPVCEFSLYHLMEVDDPCALFPIRYLEIQ